MLTGEQAITYVRTRQGLGDQLNVTRMARQREYMVGFLEALRDSISDSATFALDAYEKTKEHVVTDCTTSGLTALVNRLVGYELEDVVSIEGQNVAGEQFMEYHVTQEDLDKVVLKYLYAPKK